MTAHRCPYCSRYVRDVRFAATRDGDITKVTGQCADHGLVQITDWTYEDMVGKYGDVPAKGVRP